MALKQFSAALKDSSESAEMNLKIGEIKTSSLHHGINKTDNSNCFPWNYLMSLMGPGD